jgi:hypothetical protein
MAKEIADENVKRREEQEFISLPLKDQYGLRNSIV